MSQECAAVAVATPARFVLLSAEKGFRKWRVERQGETFYVVICRPWQDSTYRWLISPNGARWADVSRDELRRYLDKTP